MEAAVTEDKRVLPKPPIPPRPPIDKLYCSLQRRVEDLHVHVFDIACGKHGLCGYLGTLSAMKYRQLAWSPVTICGIPVTPRENPKTGHTSFFIIRLIDSNNPRYHQVDLLFQDTNLYFVGFRRRVVLEAGQEAASSDGWGRWNQFEESDLKLPPFFNAKDSGISSSYCDVATTGGFETFEEILFVLGTFEDRCIAKDRMQRACYNVMVMISEATRLRSVYTEMVRRIVHNWSPQRLDKELIENVDNWTQMGNQVLIARSKGEMDFKTKLQEAFVGKLMKDRKQSIQVLGDLLDEHTGEVLLININWELLGYTESEIARMDDEAKAVRVGGPAGRTEADFTHEAI